LRHDAVANHRHPPAPGIGAGEIAPGLKPFVEITAVPTRPHLGDVGVGDDQSAGENQFAGSIEMGFSDVIMQPIDRPHRDGQQHRHRDAAEDRAGDEVRRQDGFKRRQTRDILRLKLALDLCMLVV